MATGSVDSIFQAQCAILMTSMKITTPSFCIHGRIFISKEILFLSITLGLKHVKPNIGKLFKITIILITQYLNLNWNIVKKVIFFTPKNDCFQMRIFIIVIGFRGMLCAYLNPVLIILR